MHMFGICFMKYSVIKKDGLNFVRLYFLNYTWHVNDLYLKEVVLNFKIPPLERSPSAQPCSSVSWEQNGYYATSTMDRSRRERRPGASLLAPEISWCHTLRLFLVGVRKRSSLCTISTKNFGQPKKTVSQLRWTQWRKTLYKPVNCLKNNSCLMYWGILQTTPTEDAG